MKYTNIKKLLIKFMGGGLINFPTRFLKWIKIDGNAEGDDGGGGGGDAGSMSMYDAWMKVFDGFKVSQDNNDNNILTVTPALYAIQAYNYEQKTSDTPISLAFMNTQTNKYYEYGEKSISKIFDIKNAPDDIYEQSFDYDASYIQLLYDLDELNEKAHDINYAVESITLNHRTYNHSVVELTKGQASYVPYSGVFKFNDKYYVWFPSSMD